MYIYNYHWSDIVHIENIDLESYFVCFCQEMAIGERYKCFFFIYV